MKDYSRFILKQLHYFNRNLELIKYMYLALVQCMTVWSIAGCDLVKLGDQEDRFRKERSIYSHKIYTWVKDDWTM